MELITIKEAARLVEYPGGAYGLRLKFEAEECPYFKKHISESGYVRYSVIKEMLLKDKSFKRKKRKNVLHNM